MNLTKISETATKITLGWTPVPGAVGYRFQSSSQAPKWSHTFDATRSQVTFSKAAWYKVEALGVEAAGDYPTTAPTPSNLPFAEAALRPGFQTMKVDANSANVGGQGSPVAGGNDVLLDLQGLKRAVSMLFWGSSGQRIKVVNGGTWEINAPRSTGAYGRGGPRVRSADNVGPEHFSLTGYVTRGSGLCDASVVAPLNGNTLCTLQRWRNEYPLTDQAEPSEHVDALQVQGRLRRLEIGMSTIGMCGVRAGNDQGKGIMLNLAPQLPFECDIDHVNFFAPDSLTGAAIFKGYRSILMRTHEVYFDKRGTHGNLWGPGSGAFYPQNFSLSGTAPRRVASWPAIENWDGVVTEGPPPGGDFCPS